MLFAILFGIGILGLALVWVLGHVLTQEMTLPHTTEQVPQTQEQIFFSFIIPARNEAHNLRELIPQLIAFTKTEPHWPHKSEIIVFDDESTDATATTCAEFGISCTTKRSVTTTDAQAVSQVVLPLEQWKGKNRACFLGATAAQGNILFFLDADVRVQGHIKDLPLISPLLGNLSDLVGSNQRPWALSFLPYQESAFFWQSLSLFCFLLMGLGSANFSRLSKKKTLYGQTLIIPSKVYFRLGGHGVVAKENLENFLLSDHLHRNGVTILTATAKAKISIKMFQTNIIDMTLSWLKGFIDIPQKLDPRIKSLSMFWVTGFVILILSSAAQTINLYRAYPNQWGVEQYLLLAFCFVPYLFGAYALSKTAQKLGNFHILGYLLFPVPLFYLFSLYPIRYYYKLTGKDIKWKGRSVS